MRKQVLTCKREVSWHVTCDVDLLHPGQFTRGEIVQKEEYK